MKGCHFCCCCCCCCIWLFMCLYTVSMDVDIQGQWSHTLSFSGRARSPSLSLAHAPFYTYARAGYRAENRQEDLETQNVCTLEPAPICRLTCRPLTSTCRLCPLLRLHALAPHTQPHPQTQQQTLCTSNTHTHLPACI